MKPIKNNFHFVVHEHQSSHHHFDFRLEMDGVLKSWAVPKGPSMNPAEKHLAIAVSDHPLEYAHYQGIIPKGQYGAGPVVIWDQGTYQPESEPMKSIENGVFTFSLNGEKLHGKFCLRRFAGRPNQWLLYKMKDSFVDLNWTTPSLLTSERIKHLRTKNPPCAKSS